ncbi:class I SAM-dependent methyltransferase [Jidongwangia harbinensis]|nr:class I SAM-dependent methyltransferase [Jidongwangia harbinensis]
MIADVGCGTGSLALLPARGKPLARIVGFDPDAEVLALARPQNLSSSGRG